MRRALHKPISRLKGEGNTQQENLYSKKLPTPSEGRQPLQDKPAENTKAQYYKVLYTKRAANKVIVIRTISCF